jgi:NTP pyrophosphatase (non-canonical NTP hydrolase)
MSRKEMIMLSIDSFVREVGKNAENHGWWEEERSFGELIALCHSELSEALEEYRNGKQPNNTYYSCKAPRDTPIDCHLTVELAASGESCRGCQYAKPEGIPSELADCIIRICDICNHYNIDLESMLREKHDYNKLRPYKHGGKVI